MAVVFQRNEIGLECNNVFKTVPDNDVARLMYYLNAVCYTIECDNDPDIQRFRDFQNWASLSIDEQKALLIVCYAFSPDVLNNRVFFHNAALCGEYTNSFYTINQVRSQLLATESIVIGGRLRDVSRIMTYTMPWMKTYYFDPMERLARRLDTSSRPSVYSRPTYTPSVVRQPTRNSDSSQCCSRRCCRITCCT